MGNLRANTERESITRKENRSYFIILVSDIVMYCSHSVLEMFYPKMTRSISGVAGFVISTSSEEPTKK